MKAGRIGLYVAGAAVGAGLAYLLALLPNYGPASSETPKAVAKKGDGKGRAPAAPVTAATVIASDMPVILAAPGTVEPFANVAIKTRVDGQIIEVLFREGDLVNKGDVLFRLDDRMVKAQISQAEATIAKDQASLRDAEATLARREALVGKKIVTEAAADQARYAVEGLKASIAAGQALLESQKTQLDYLTIRAPITGRTGGLSSKVGAMVRGVDAALPLVVINQTKPIWVTFAVPQGELGALRRALAAKALADISVPGGAKPVVVQGTIGFVDNQVDKQTGTITARVIAENADEVLWPGLSAEVALTVEMKRGLLAVPATAVLPAQQGMISWVIGPDNKVEPRVVAVERIVGQTAYLRDGVKAGERVVTDGQIRLAPGVAVTVEEPRRPPPGRTPASEELRMNGRG
jgi:membrane fusion protein, multidrug efflux system